MSPVAVWPTQAAAEQWLIRWIRHDSTCHHGYCLPEQREVRQGHYRGPSYRVEPYAGGYAVLVDMRYPADMRDMGWDRWGMVEIRGYVRRAAQ